MGILLVCGVIAFAGYRMLSSGGENPNRQAMSVFLCAAEDLYRACEGRGVATDPEKRVIEQRIRAMPEVTDVRFRNRQESTPDSGLIGALKRGMKPSALPESFRVVLADHRDLPEVKGKIRALPGVSQVIPDQRPEDAQRKRAEAEKKRDEVTISLLNCDGSEANRDAIGRALRAMPEVKSVEFIDRSKAWAQWLESNDGETLGMAPEDMSGSFIVRVPDLTQIKAFVAKVKAMEGVTFVIAVQDVLAYQDAEQGR
ncbi:hypothetical protein IMZ11_32400 [Microtetraspora sp. AC03309]|uniref:permease-like cell division protein FtsX n=1 Tax=Microtetraspora sp. AC03309 TaxID=2779376 RepID=UPI001E571FB5|nr:permease-like cell division protein FtsX [Microtetraspora sp. AC03309]MCC5580331.1 hypothetical protein [Microtetraspora sp. AC03309]